MLCLLTDFQRPLFLLHKSPYFRVTFSRSSSIHLRRYQLTSIDCYSVLTGSRPIPESIVLDIATASKKNISGKFMKTSPSGCIASVVLQFTVQFSPCQPLLRTLVGAEDGEENRAEHYDLA
jgi:hypothetical protein